MLKNIKSKLKPIFTYFFYSPNDYTQESDLL